MKLTVKPVVVLMSLLACPFAFAETATTTNSTPDVDALVKQINSQTQALEKQVAQLKREVKRLKADQAKTTATLNPEATANATPLTVNAHPLPASKPNSPSYEAISPLLKMGASPVIVAPYIGVPSEYDASDLLIFQSTYKLDQTMLQRNLLLRQKAAKDNIVMPDTPTLILSGKIESQVYGSKTYSGPNSSDVNLTGAELLAAVHINNWVSGLITLNYDDAPPSQGSAQRVTNSDFSVDQAFATIGNLSVTPFYATLGQRTIPFGHYDTYMISDTVPKMMFKMLERAVLFGYDSQSTGSVRPYATTFVFKDDTTSSNGSSHINNGGANLGLRLATANGLKSNVGISGVANVADSNGMQSNGLSGTNVFQGFAYGTDSTPAEQLIRKVPGFNAYADLSNDKVYLNSEFAGATSSFNANDMTYNGHGAKPSAWHSEAAYMFNIASFPANVAVGYDHSWQAVAMNMPQQRYITALNVSFIRNTILSLEFNREINYATADTGTGLNSAVIVPTGHYQNNATVQFGVYF